MSNLDELEHDVEQARAKFADDLARLRSPSTVNAFKDELVSEATHAKDEWVGKAQTAVKDGVAQVVDDIKARAAANPAAALAIGAGMAWRLAHKPPIASLLVGIGLFSLFRTSPSEPRWTSADGGGGALLAKASEYAQTVQGTGKAWANSAGEAATESIDVAKDALGAIKDKAMAAVGAASATANQTGQQLVDQTMSAAEGVSAGVAELAERSKAAAGYAAMVARDTVADPEIRDRVLLGAAALAVTAALGMAYQRRYAEFAQHDA